MTKKSVLQSWLVPSLVATLACALFQWVGNLRPPEGPAPELAASVARLERRVRVIEAQVALAARAHPEPAAVTRVAEERGLDPDDAWNQYFDEIVTRLDRLEERLEIVGPPDELPEWDEQQLARLAQFAEFTRATEGLTNTNDQGVFFGAMPRLEVGRVFRQRAALTLLGNVAVSGQISTGGQGWAISRRGSLGALLSDPAASEPAPDDPEVPADQEQ